MKMTIIHNGFTYYITDSEVEKCTIWNVEVAGQFGILKYLFSSITLQDALKELKKRK